MTLALSILLAAIVPSGTGRAQSSGPLVSDRLLIQGARLSIAPGDEAWTLSVGESATVRTCYGGVCGAMASTDPHVVGLQVRAELSGPELSAPVTYTSTPGGAFVLPGFQTEGTYLLSSIRLVRVAVPGVSTEEILGSATPSAVVLEVRQILFSTATVRQLTLAELQARGIEITQQNFNAYNFAVGFAFDGGPVTIEFPVLFQNGGQADLLSKPQVNLDGLPAETAALIRRWQPPNLVPFKLEVAAPEGLVPGEELEEVPPETKLFGVIVLPGNVSFLHKFFDAQLLVANGAPAGSGAVLANVTGSIRLPAAVPHELLRLAGTTPSVASGQKVPVVGASGETRFGPGEQGTASFTLEGLVAGTHVVTLEIGADLERPNRDVLPLAGKLKAAIEVVDARFNLTFNHPDVVREGEPYTLFVTITNVSPSAWEQGVSVGLEAGQLQGAHKEDQSDSFVRTVGTLNPGEGATVEFRLVADVSGRCVATTYQSPDPAAGTIRLRAGVGEQGIPLSPSSLVLPRFTEQLPQSLIPANVRLLGLAYSLAVAPPGSIPPSLPRLVKSDVERRAVDLAEAGQRLYLGDERLPSLEALLLDQLGNRHDLPEFDQLRRTLTKGRDAAEALAALIRQEQESRSLSASSLLQHAAVTMSYARPYLAATVERVGSGEAPTLEVRKLNGVTGVTYLAYPAGDPRALRSLPFGETYDILGLSGGGHAPLAVVGRLASEAGYTLVVHGPLSGTPMPVTLSFVAPAPSGGFVRVDLPNLAVPPGDAWAVEAVHASGDARPLTYELLHLATGRPVVGAPSPAIRTIELPSFRLVGARQDFVLDPYGSGVWYLFNRPPAKADAETGSRYEVQTDFHGLDTTTSGTTIDRTTTFSAASALLQPSSERVVAVRFAQPVSAIPPGEGQQPVIGNVHRLDLTGLRDAWGNTVSAPVPEIQIEPGHVGGLVEGKVLRGTGAAVPGATVRLIRDRVVPSKDGLDAEVLHDLVAERPTDSEGTFFFPFIEEPILSVSKSPEKGTVQSGFRIQAIVPPGPDPLAPEEKEEVSSVIRLQSRLARINIALLGRGTVKGRVVYGDGSAVPLAVVTAASTLFSEVRSAEAGSDGAFQLDALPVGPITVTARDAAGRSAYVTTALAAPGATANVTLRLERTQQPRTGTVSGRVLLRRDTPAGPVTDPAPGASVAVYSAGAPYGQATTASTGTFRFEGVPAGRVTVQAADFSVSRSSALVDADLAADGTVDVTLTLAASTPRAVAGRVLFRDPLTQADLAVAGATVFVEGPGNSAVTDGNGDYRIDGVPTVGAGEPSYRVHAIDFVRKVEGTTLVSVNEQSPDPVVAATIILRDASAGAIDGVVLDPLGRPAAGVTVTLLPIGERTTASDGTFSFEGVPVRPYTVSAHKGTGLEPGAIGWIGESPTEVLFGGHRAFATVRLRGAGTVNVRTRTTSAGVRSPVSYKPTWFSPQELVIRQAAAGIETTTDDDGRLTLVLPVGELSVSATNPFHGTASFRGTIDFAGQVKDVDLLFGETSTVTGVVVDVDGVTPVPGVDVELEAAGLLPQRQRTNGLGAFRFELVPPGSVSVSARGFCGAIERTGRTYGHIGSPGQPLDLVVRLKPKGTVRGRVVDETAPGVISPLAGAQVALQENDYPFRRLPVFPGYMTAGADGRFEVTDVNAGRFTVIARDPGQVTRQGSRYGELRADFEVVDAGDVVLSGQVADLTVLVRDPQTGSPVPDAQVTLSNGEATVAGADGRASFFALPLGTWAVHAFHAPTGRGGQLADIHLGLAGQNLEVVVVLDQRGRVSGYLYDDEARTRPVGGGTVRLRGTVNGRLWGAGLTALATTSREAGSLGAFLFDGLPVATYSLKAGVEGSSRQAEASATLTPTAPEAQVALVLEAVRDVYVRLFQKELARGLVEINPDPVLGDGVFAVSYGRDRDAYSGEPIPLSNLLVPTAPFPLHSYRFADVLATKSFWIAANEASGEGRRAFATSTGLANASLGAGTQSSPYQIVLLARGTVRVTVRDAAGAAAAGATVRVQAGNGTWEGAADGLGRAVFTAVEEGQVTVSASVPGTPFGASASRSIQWDDEILDVDLVLSPVVSAHGIVYEAPDGDTWSGNPSTLAPASGVLVRINPSAGAEQLLITGADGVFRYSGLAPGPYVIRAESLDGQRIAHASGTLGNEHGTDYGIPPLVLDASRPRILSLTPPNGASSVSRTAPVEILFSEALSPEVLPSGSTSTYFGLSFTGAPAAGAWSSSVDAEGRQVVRFTPSPRYENSATYTLEIKGGTNGVRDREGRPLTDSGDIGASFTTSDTDGPHVVGTVPSFSRPVDPAASIRIDFGEVLVLTPAQIRAAVVFEWKNASGSWAAYPATTSLTRGGYSILVEQPQGVTFTDDSLRRRLTVSGLTDAAGNPMPVWVGEYRIYDRNSPVLSIGLPPNAPSGDLSASASYILSPSFSAAGLDDVTVENPFGDVDRVEYTFSSAADPTQPASAPGVVQTAAPFTYGFVAAYTGDGATPRPFPVWVKAFDTSGNASAQIRLDMKVLPNVPPVVTGVTVLATAPVAGSFYAGSTIAVSATGIVDGDDARLTLMAELRREAGAASELVSAAPARTVDRPAEGWAALPAQAFSFVVPVTEAEGAALFVRVRAVDTKGAEGAGDAPFTVADDATRPSVTNLVARRPNGEVSSSFVIGDTFVLEVSAHDGETGIKALAVATTGGILPSTLTATRVGISDLFRTSSITVPASLGSPVSVSVTATAEDYGGNASPATLSLDLAPSNDPTKPVAEWLSPFEGAIWPAAYTSVDATKGGVDLLLRVRVTDKDVDASGNEIPGTSVTAKLRGPLDASGSQADWTTASCVSATAGEWTCEGLWRVPNGVAAGTSLPFEVEVVDAGANKTTKSVVLRAVAARYVYEAATTSVGSGSDIQASAGAESLPIFLLDGTTLSLYPATSGLPRAYASLHLYSGGALSAGAGSPVTVRRTTLTSPEVTSYDSLVPYYPLELSIGETLAVGHGAAIDVTGRGLLGGDSSHAAVALPGERPSTAGAAGSHGGMGYPLRSDWLTSLPDSGSVYGNVREPRLPGGGGGVNGGPGGAGGGVVRIDAPSAVVRLYGDVSADGGVVPSGGSTGAAGGSVWVRARRVDGRGTIRANGSFTTYGTSRPGGAGGRVSVAWQEPVSPNVRESADGAVSPFWGYFDGTKLPLAGAGTVFTERLDASGIPVDRGTLRISNPASVYVPAITQLTGLGSAVVTAVDVASRKLTIRSADAIGSIEGEAVVVSVVPGGGGSPTSVVLPVSAQARVAGSIGTADQAFSLTVGGGPTELAPIAEALAAGRAATAKARLRYVAFEASGPVRVVSTDELEVGGVVDQRSALSLDGSARILLGSEKPAISFDGTTPAPGADIGPNGAIDVRFRAADAIGLSRIETMWSVAGTTSTRDFSEPVEVLSDPNPIRVTIPLAQPAGPVTFRVRAVDRAGRTAEGVATWNVTGDTTPPVITKIQSYGDAFQAGETVTVDAQATDDVKLHLIRIELAGQIVESTSSSARLVWLSQPVAAVTAYTIKVTAIDSAGNSATSSKSINVNPRTDSTAPTVTVSCPSAGAVLPSEYDKFVIEASASDDLGVHRVEVLREGETTPLATSYATSGYMTTFSAVIPAIALPKVTGPTSVRFRLRAFDFAGNVSAESLVDVDVRPAVRLLASGPNDWAALAGQTAYLDTGTLVLDEPRRFGGLIVLRGATITHSAGAGRGVGLDVDGPLFVECGGSIDVTGAGYAGNTSYPGAAGSSAGGGSHMGAGGLAAGTTLAETYGSVTHPQEAGSGGWGSPASRGGGVVRIDAQSLILGGSKASIRANGVLDSANPGAGGSIWISAGTISGTGLIEASAADPYGNWSGTRGGGGAVAIEYGALVGSPLAQVRALGGGGASVASSRGGTGTVFLKGPGENLGTLRLDDTCKLGQATVLPSLGSGAAQVGTAGSTLVTDRATDVPAYFSGHWVEVRREGSLLGTWRVSSASGRTVVLAPNDTEAIALQVGDRWQGLYRFDNLDFKASCSILQSDDPIQVTSATLSGVTFSGYYAGIQSSLTAQAVSITGNVALQTLSSASATVKAKATLTSFPMTSSASRGLDLTVSGTLTIEGDGKIDVTGRGLPGITSQTTNVAGSHIGLAKGNAQPTGSVEHPQEPGQGGTSASAGAGGGAVRIRANALVFGGADSSIWADGNPVLAAGAGGSIWITAESITGDGSIRAGGGLGTYSGGGGAVVVEYRSATGTALSRISARQGGAGAGAGTILLKGPGDTFGRLSVNSAYLTAAMTAFPSLGGGTAQSGTTGATLVTDRTSTIPAYFVGHWVEIRRNGALLGTWRVGSVADRTVTLEPSGQEVIGLQAGDQWQGVYRFDSVTVTQGANLTSADPVYDRLPTISVSSPTAGASFASGTSIPVGFSTTDDWGIAKVILTLGGVSVEVPGPWPTSGVIRAPWLVASTSINLDVTVVDLGGQRVSTSVPLTILAAAPLTATISSPRSNAKLWGGTIATVGIGVPDSRPVRRVTVSLAPDGATLESQAGPWLSASLPIAPVAADESRTLAVRVEDELGGVANASIPVAVLADTGPRAVSSVAEASPVAAGSSLYVRFVGSFRDVAGAKMQLKVTGSVSRDETQTAPSLSGHDWESGFNLDIPADAHGPMRIVVTAIDGAGRTGSAAPIDLEVVPPLQLAIPSPGVVHPGGTLELVMTTTGWFASQNAVLTIGGAFPWSRTVYVGGRNGEEPTIVRTIRIPVPRTALGGGSASYSAYLGGVGEAGDRGAHALSSGGWATSNTVSFTVVDDVDPTVARIRSSQRGLVSGAQVSFRANASDDGSIREVRFLVDGVPIATATGPTEMSTYDSGPYVLPAVSGPRSLVVRVEATDNAGRTDFAERTFIVLPAGTPVVRFRAPTSGAMTIAGGTVSLAAEVTHSRPISQVAFFREGEAAPFAKRSDGGTEAEFVVPAGVAAGSDIVLRVEVTDDLGAIGTGTTAVRIVDGDLLSDGTTVAVDDLSHENRAVIVQGRVSVRGFHRFARLLVLPGAALTHAAAAGATAGMVDVEVTGDVYVSRTGSVNAAGLGFEGGLQGTNASLDGRTAPGTSGATGASGGSHGGEGEWSPEGAGGESYDSVRAPSLPGSGGSAAGAGLAGGAGGGVIRLVVGGRLIVDGELNANGQEGEGGAAGAGGSISAEAASIGGSGRVLAVGGSPGDRAGLGGSAGGGRISLTGSLEDEAPETSAASGSQWFASGAPGTVFLLEPGDRYGHLLVDGGSCERVMDAYLGELGRSWLESVQGRSFHANLPAGLEDVVGRPVEVWRGELYGGQIAENATFVGRFLVFAFDRTTGTLTLDESAEGQVRAGDLYRGVQELDSVSVRGRALLGAFELVEGIPSTGPVASLYAPGIALSPSDATPSVSAAVPTRDVPPGGTLSVSVEAADGQGLARYVLWIEGAAGSELEVPIAGAPTQDSRTLTYLIPSTLPPGSYVLGIAVFDSANQRTATAFRLHVAPSSGFVASTSTAGWRPSEIDLTAASQEK